MISVLLVLSSFAALAETPDVNNPGAPYKGDTGYDTEWRGTADGTLTIRGLQKDDTVKLYQILAYDDDASTLVSALTDASDVTKGAQGWKVIAPFAAGENAITGTDLKAILSTGITDVLAGKIAKKAVETDSYTAAYSPVADTNGVATVGTTEAPVTPRPLCGYRDSCQSWFDLQSYLRCF